MLAPSVLPGSSREAVLEAVRNGGLALQYAHENFKNDPEVVLEAVRQNVDAFKYAHEDLKSDRDFVLAVAREKGAALKYAHERFKKDRDVVLKAVRNHESVLLMIHGTLRTDRGVVLEAVRGLRGQRVGGPVHTSRGTWWHGPALLSVAARFAGGREVVLEAVRQGGASSWSTRTRA